METLWERGLNVLFEKLNARQKFTALEMRPLGLTCIYNKAFEGIRFVLGTAPSHVSSPQIKMARWPKADK